MLSRVGGVADTDATSGRDNRGNRFPSSFAVPISKRRDRPQGVIAIRAVRSAMLAAALILATGMSGVVILPTVSAAQSLKHALKFHEDADKLREQGRYADAELLYKRAVVIYEQALEHEALWQPALESKEAKLVQHVLAVTLNNLAEVYSAQSRYAEAELLHKRSLAIKEKVLDPNHPAVATSLNNLAKLYYKQYRYDDAEPLYKRVLAMKEKALGANDRGVGTALNNLAGLYKDQGRYAEAEQFFRRTLGIDEKALGPNHPDVAISLNNLALLYSIQGRYTDAERLYKRALGIDEKLLGPNDPAVAPTLNNLATLYSKLGRYADAEPLSKRSLSINEKALGLSHPNVATSLNNLVATSLNNLASLYQAQGRYADAEPLYKRSLAIKEKLLGPNHPDVATALNNLAGLYKIDQHRYADAESLYKRALEIDEKLLGPNHPDVATVLNNLAVLYVDQRRYADAEPLYKRALEIERKLMPSRPSIPLPNGLLSSRSTAVVTSNASAFPTLTELAYPISVNALPPTVFIITSLPDSVETLALTANRDVIVTKVAPVSSINVPATLLTTTLSVRMFDPSANGTRAVPVA